MKGLSLFNISLLIVFVVYLTKKCNLLEITEKNFIWTIFLLCVIFILGFCRGYIFEQNYISSINIDSYYDNNAIVKKVYDQESYIVKLSVDPESLVIVKTSQKLLPGMVIDLKCFLDIPNDSLNSGGFSYKNYLKYKMIKFTTKAKNIIVIRQVKNFDYYLYKYQEYYLKQLKPYLGNKIRFIESIFLGNSKKMNEAEIGTWRNMGILHLQAVSGSQIGAALDILMFIFILTPRKGLSKYIIFSIPLIFYGFITNSPSIWRVIIYLIIIKILEINNKGHFEMLSLMLSLFILLMINPGMLFQISLQLSYVITTSLLLFNDYINKVKNKIYKIILVGVLSILFSWPILIYYFQEISLLSVIFTPLFAPFIQIIIFISCIFLLFPYLIIFLKPLVYILNQLLLFLELVTKFFSNFDLPILRGRVYSIFTVIFFYIMIIFWNNNIYKKYYRKILVCIFIIIMTWNIFGVNFTKEHVLVTFINVGQGDCILIECKELDKTILIDGGLKNEYLDMGKSEVIPFLKRKGIFKIDYLISTHNDNDHRGGLESVLESYDVINILIPYNRRAEYTDWISTYGSKVQEINEGYKIVLGNITIDIINPLKVENDLDSNASSIVLSLTYGKSNILLTADCDIDVLDRLLKEGRNFDVIKAPHHGSKNSYRENIYDQLKTKCVIFSVGKNLYGHPSKDIINDLVLSNIDYFRTDYNKDIAIKLKSNEIEINDRKYID
ncbi:MAG: DNA internalization-related competence protein ComEC/Rec2 [Firmicutes bacterium]|nr:DNA internalization-related competence protein ComEC/Rec2 [Bacillota bacterium]